MIPVDPKIDKKIDRYFSKRVKLVDFEKIFTNIIAEAQFIHEQFIPKKANTYKAGFDNGWKMGYYEGLVKAAKICLKVRHHEK